MTDAAFAAMMIQQVALERPAVAVGFDSSLAAPAYCRYHDHLPARIMPARHSRLQNLLGEQSRMTHAAYLQAVPGPSGEPVPCAGDGSAAEPVAVGDVLVWKIASCSLDAPAAAGAVTIIVSDPDGLSAGSLTEIGAVEMREQATVTALDGTEATLAGPLAHDHEAGAAVIAVRRFEVLAVRCWPGLAHHLELALAEVEM